jgi:hypothetical protein
MTTIDDDVSATTHNESLANMQETMNSQADSLVTMLNQLANIQLCLNVSQQPPSSGYIPAQQQHMFTNHNKRNNSSQGNGRGFPQ